jgi:hypothetical protein
MGLGDIFDFSMAGECGGNQTDENNLIAMHANWGGELAHLRNRCFRASAARWNCSGQENPQGREKKMKNSILAIALAVASTPFMFAAQASTPQANPPAGTSKTASTKTTTKKTKHVKKPKSAKPSTTAKPAASVSAVKPVAK